jgi:hypothetical protein
MQSILPPSAALRCHPVQRSAATFGDHQRVCKVSSMPEACGWVRKMSVRVQGSKVCRRSESSRIVDDHGFFMCDVEGRVRVQDLDTRVHQHLARCFVHFFATAPSGIQMICTFTPRERAAITACISDGSENVNILTRSDFEARLIASRMGAAESSGKTIKERDGIPDSL